MSRVFLLLMLEEDLGRIIKLDKVVVLCRELRHCDLLILQESYSLMQVSDVIIQAFDDKVFLLQCHLHRCYLCSHIQRTFITCFSVLFLQFNF